MDPQCQSMSSFIDVPCAMDEDQELEFTLKVRINSLRTLRLAAAARFGGDGEEDLAEILGPIEDPAIKDCLMALILPRSIEGCTMLSVSVE